MDMIVTVLLLVVGLALIVFGADYLVDGASSLARRWGLSEFIIGMTIVGMGTSAPEMVVSFIGAASGNADIAVGNVVGSNIFNTLLILGLTAIILPMGITKSNFKRDIPVNIGITALLIVLGLKHTLFGFGAADGLTRTDGAVLLVAFAAYIWMCLSSKDETPEEAGKVMNPWLSLLFVAGGLAALVFGGQLFVNSATDIAKALGVSDKFIAVTILAGGTSLPELATCIAAAVKKKGQLALGNIIGSNVFNILLILGGSALIHPLNFIGFGWVDLSVLLLSALYLLSACFVGKKYKVDRIDGILFFLTWAGYMTYLFINL